MDLRWMLDQLDVGPLVPQRYGQWRRIVTDGVIFFLEHLSPPRLAEVLAEQMTLPAEAGVGQRVIHLMHSSPALHKLGQVIARRRELDADFRHRLQRLESMEPRTPLEQFRPLLDRELAGAVRKYRIQIGPTALAEASVAVVLPCTWSAPGEEQVRQGVLKVLKPGIVQKLEEDLEILGKLADFIDQRYVEYGLPAVDYRDTFDEASTILRHEVKMSSEQTHLARAARLYAGRSKVQVPELLPFCTPHLTAMERLYGTKVTDIHGAGGRAGRQLAETIVRAMLAEVIISPQEQSMFHGDPHAGNLLATEDGRLGILDWSLSGQLRRDERRQMAQILVGAFVRSPQRIAQALEALASLKPAEQQVQPVVAHALRELGGCGLPGLEWLMRLLDEAARAGVRFRSDLMLLRKAFFTLEGVVADLCGSCSPERVLAEAALEELAGEWPRRLLRPFYCRDFATGLSSADLTQILSMLPLAAMNWWMNAWGVGPAVDC